MHLRGDPASPEDTRWGLQVNSKLGVRKSELVMATPASSRGWPPRVDSRLLDPTLSGNEMHCLPTAGFGWDSRHIMARVTLKPRSPKGDPSIRGWRMACWGHLVTGMERFWGPSTAQSRDRFPRPPGSTELPLLGVLESLAP